MASIASDPGGRKRIIFMGLDGRRKAIRLGKVTSWQAQDVRGHVEHLLAAASTGHAPPAETSRWAADLPDVLRKRLEAKGLVAPKEAPAPAPAPEPAGPTLGAFLADYMAKRVDLKESTRVALGQTVRYLTAHFGADKPLEDITPGDADEWRLYLVGKGLSEATIRRRCGAAKQLLRAAVRKGFLPSNPFQDLKASNVANTARQYYVSPDVAQKVIDACPDAEWRLIFGLCRYAGLRCPSELVGLRWGDVLWDKGRFVVHSPKTERHDGQATRTLPIFPELLPHLQAAFDAAEPGAEYVITRYRLPNANLSTQLRRILWRAGIDPWPRLFQNLRASFDTDLAARFPAHVCARWLGHTPAIAAKHYLQLRETDFEAAAGHTLTKAAHYPNEAAQKAAQCQAVSSLPEREVEADDVQKSPVLPQDSESYTTVHENRVGDTGLEPVTSCVSSRRSSRLS